MSLIVLLSHSPIVPLSYCHFIALTIGLSDDRTHIWCVNRASSTTTELISLIVP